MTEDKTESSELRSDEQCKGGAEANPESRDTPPGWEEVAADPEPQDLGYETSQWQRIPGPDDKRTIFAPANEATLHDQAFVIVDKKGLRSLLDCR